MDVGPVTLSEGTHIMRYEFDTDYDSEVNNWLFSFDKTVVHKISDTSNEDELVPVSYTHLTLPTICSV